jgi:hypothetical protein
VSGGEDGRTLCQADPEDRVYRTTQDVLELRRWAEGREARPCREEETGRLALAMPGDRGGQEVGWEEFEPVFRVAGHVCIYDDAPGAGARRCFIGSPDEALEFLCSGSVDVDRLVR